MKISAYLAMDAVALTPEQSLAAQMAGGEWVIVHARNGRQLVSALAPEAMIPGLLALLAPYHPTLLGVWNDQGVALAAYPVLVAEYLEVMPDQIAAGDPPVLTRPTVARDVCGWAGWLPRAFP